MCAIECVFFLEFIVQNCAVPQIIFVDAFIWEMVCVCVSEVEISKLILETQRRYKIVNQQNFVQKGKKSKPDFFFFTIDTI